MTNTMKKIFSANVSDTYISRELNAYIMTKDITLQRIINDNYEFITIIIIESLKIQNKKSRNQ